MLLVVAVFLIFICIIYFSIKIVAEHFEAQRTNKLTILSAVILSGVVSGFLTKYVDIKLLSIIISILATAFVYQYVLAIENYKKSLAVAVISQILIVIFLSILVIILKMNVQ